MRALWLVMATMVAPELASARGHRAPPVTAPAVASRVAAPVVRTVWLDRCAGGCTVHGASIDDAVDNTSTIIPTGTYTLAAFAYTDAEWSAIVKCVQDVYSPYAVTITDTEPASGLYNKTLVAGVAMQLGLDQGATSPTLGLAEISGDCSALEDTMAFAFANSHPHDATFIDNVCWTVAQETAHLYGLDHEYVFTDGVSACSDPMTYRDDCNGEKFFRPHEAYCGTFAQANCRCGQAQSSHRLLLERFGSAAPTTTAPVVSVTSGLDGSTLAAGAQIVAHASSQRGIDHVDLLLNGFAWATEPGVAFAVAGQPAADYTLTVPANVPGGVTDVVVAAFDDLGTVTQTAAVTVTIGEPCTTGATCAAHQSCTSGRCAWPTATAELGDSCSYAQECASGLCNAAGACTQACDIDDTTTCPSGFLCDGIGSNTDGVCSREGGGSGGFCAAGGGSPVPVLLAVGVLAAISQRKRRRE